jgi:Inner membrane protein YgaP-like, transmembrane domain
MRKNLGSIDKRIRLLIAAIVFGLFFGEVISGTIAYILMALSIIFLVTSLINFCPLYGIFKFSTNKEKK